MLVFVFSLSALEGPSSPFSPEEAAARSLAVGIGGCFGRPTTLDASPLMALEVDLERKLPHTMFSFCSPPSLAAVAGFGALALRLGAGFGASGDTEECVWLLCLALSFLRWPYERRSWDSSSDPLTLPSSSSSSSSSLSSSSSSASKDSSLADSSSSSSDADTSSKSKSEPSRSSASAILFRLAFGSTFSFSRFFFLSESLLGLLRFLSMKSSVRCVSS